MDKERDSVPGEGTVVELAGYEIVYRIVGEQTGGASALLELTVGPGLMVAPPHMHRREDEVSCVLEGELMVQVGERVVRATPGQVVFKPRGVFHASWNPGPAPARFLEFISPAGFEEFIREAAALPSAAGGTDVSSLLELAARYQVEFDLGRLPEILEQHRVMAPWPEKVRIAESHRRGVSHFIAARPAAG